MRRAAKKLDLRNSRFVNFSQQRRRKRLFHVPVSGQNPFHKGLCGERLHPPVHGRLAANDQTMVNGN